MKSKTTKKSNGNGKALTTSSVKLASGYVRERATNDQVERFCKEAKRIGIKSVSKTVLFIRSKGFTASMPVVETYF